MSEGSVKTVRDVYGAFARGDFASVTLDPQIEWIEPDVPDLWFSGTHHASGKRWPAFCGHEYRGHDANEQPPWQRLDGNGDPGERRRERPIRADQQIRAAS